MELTDDEDKSNEKDVNKDDIWKDMEFYYGKTCTVNE